MRYRVHEDQPAVQGSIGTALDAHLLMNHPVLVMNWMERAADPQLT